MTALSSYSTGTVTVSAGGTTVTGVSSVWSGTNVKPGDILQIGNFQSVISDVTDTTHLVIPPWGGGAQAGVAYKIWQVSPQRFAGAQAMGTVNELVAALEVSGFFWFVDVGLTAPDPSYGDDGQWAYQPSTGAYWLKTGGAWVASGSPAAGYGGTSTTSLAIGTGSKAFTTQSGLAYNGARVRATATSDVTKWLEGPATYSGTTLTIGADKSNGSGTIASWTFAIAGEPSNPSLSNGHVFVGNASNIATDVAMSGDVTISNTGVTAIGAHKVTRAMQAQGSARSVSGVTGNAAADLADIQGTTDQVLRVNGAGTALAFGAVDLTKTAAATLAFTTYTPAVASTGGSLTTVTINSASSVSLGGGLIFVTFDFTITTLGTGSGYLDITVPTYTSVVMCCAFELNNGAGMASATASSSTQIRLKLYNNGNTAAANARWQGGAILKL